MKRIVLIDASFCAYWRHFAREKNPRAVGAEDWIMRFVKDAAPDLCVVALDAGFNWRHDIEPDYKAQRPPRPEGVQKVLESISECSPHAVKVSGFEADDVIASYVHEHRKDAQILIVANDKDLHQLVGPSVIMFDPKANKYWDAEAVTKKHGVPPGRVREVLALAGDKSDNIPGVPGMGAVNAASLVSHMVDWQALKFAIAVGDVSRIRGAISQTLAGLIMQFGVRVLKNYELVGLRTDALRVIS